MRLQWRTATRFHDWLEKPRTIPRDMVARLCEAGILGSVDWIVAGYGQERQEVDGGPGTLDRLLQHKARRRQSLSLSAGGTSPRDWEMHLLLAPFLRGQGQTRGPSLLTVRLESDGFPGREGSDSLARIFKALHGSGNCEFAALHPLRHWQDLTDITIPGRYEVPLTIQPMFIGALWMFFLGARHLEYFDRSKLGNLEAFELERKDDGGLFVRVSPDITEAAGPEVEAEMFRLTGAFRSALRR